MRYIAFFLLLFSLNYTYSQAYKIKGEVIEYSSQASIPYAHVFIQDIMYGTVTNESGEFELTIEKQHLEKKLTVSSIGYIDQIIPISSIKNERIKVNLKEANTLLNNVTITAKIDTGIIILNKAAKAIKENYPKHKYLQKAFYRELGINDSSYTRLIEAAVSIQDNGYDAYDINKDDWTVNNARIKIDKIRKSEDYRTYSRWGSVLNTLFGHKNNLYTVLTYDLVRYFAKSKYDFHFLGKNVLFNTYEVVLEDILESPKGVIYQLSLSDKHLDSFTYRVVNIFINAEDFAILRITNQNYWAKKHVSETMDVSIPYFSLDCSYSKYKGKYYLKHVSTVKYASGSAAPYLKKGDKSVFQTEKLTLLINEVYNKKNEFDRIKKKEQSKEDVDLYDTEQPYDSAFWASYNILLLDPLLKSAKEDLEKETTLEQQFKKNGE